MMQNMTHHNTGRKHIGRKMPPQTEQAKANLSAARTGVPINGCKGGRIMQGPYWMIRVEEDHPMRGASRYVQEHRLVMAEAIGRMLEPQEVVHHIDLDKTNNELANLMLFATKAEHNTHHKLLRQLQKDNS